MRYDLHSHSTFSDGILAPSALVGRAIDQDVDVLALTDHDDTAGLDEAMRTAEGTNLELVPGAELSVSWDDLTVHVVALRIDPDNPMLVEGLATIRSGRDGRARRIAAALEREGVSGAWEGALRYVTSERLISRAHFARYLVEAGYVKSMKDVFKRYLAQGLPGYVEHRWASLGDAIGWIHAAGGDAVLAHPGRYRTMPGGMRRLIAEFKDRGGDAIEIISPSHDAADVTRFAGFARTHGLRGSVGSDFHGPDESFVDLGDCADLPAGIEPVWARW
ncbi:MAG TPA: PHP domain-containing protein [Casimicrobiaceae bacterium]|nr:PHP domain-containing protein [Casimicrobiaceae bacterium]